MTFTLHHGDAIQVLADFPAESFDVVLTDPPYSSGARKEASKGIRKSMTRSREDETWFDGDCLTTAGFSHLMRETAIACKRVLRQGGHFLCFIDWRMMPPLSAAIESADLRHVGVLVWDKTHFGMGMCFRNQFELVLHFTKGQGNDPQRRDVGNVIGCAPIRDTEHPTEKPVDLLRRILSVVTPPRGRVLDPFVGSGSTGVASIMDGFEFVGIDTSARFVDLSRQRIASAVPGGQQERLVPLEAPTGLQTTLLEPEATT